MRNTLLTIMFTGAFFGCLLEEDAPEPEVFSVALDPVEVEPGVELTRCVIKRLNNPRPIRVGEIHNVLGGPAHHLALYRIHQQEERVESYPCQEFEHGLDPAYEVPLMVTQSSEEKLTFPQGVAYTLPADAMIKMELHYINASDETLALSATSYFNEISEDDYEVEADFLYVGSPDIYLPPGESTTLGPSFFQLPPEYAGAKFFTMQGHQHEHGTDVVIESVANADAPFNPIYKLDDFNWEEPEILQYDPPVEVPDGGGFRFTCEYTNNTDRPVYFGASAEDEMCFFWMYYYPSQGAKVCFRSDNGDLTACCPGNDDLCALLKAGA